MRQRFEKNLLPLRNIRGTQEPQVQDVSVVPGRLRLKDQRPSDYEGKEICKNLLIEKLDKKFKEWEQNGALTLKINQKKDLLIK